MSEDSVEDLNIIKLLEQIQKLDDSPNSRWIKDNQQNLDEYFIRIFNCCQLIELDNSSELCPIFLKSKLPNSDEKYPKKQSSENLYNNYNNNDEISEIKI